MPRNAHARRRNGRVAARPNVYDIEAIPTDESGRRSRRPDTDARHEFLVGGTWADDEREPKFWPSRTAMFAYMLDHGGTWYAQNGGHYDALFFLPELLKGRAKFRSQQARIISVRVHGPNGPLILLDSVKLLPVSVKQLGKALGIPKLELCGDEGHPDGCAACEHEYRTLRDDAKTREYLRRDLEIVQVGLRRSLVLMGREELPGTLAAHGIELVKQAGHAPLATWAMVDGDHTIAEVLEPSEVFRDWVAGGRVEIRTPALAHAYGADIHSSYTASTFDGLPGNPSPRGPLSLYRARVTVPKMDIPPLPYRHDGRLYFPTGSWVGHFCEPEIDVATEAGCRVQILDRYRFTRDESAAGLAREWWGERQKALAEGDDFRALWFKCLLNWTWGKFSEHPTHEEMVIPENGEAESGWFEYSPTHGIFLRETVSIPRMAHCAAGAWIPSHARARLWRDGLMKTPNPAMWDTDCVWAPTKPPVDYGDYCGQWGAETWTDARGKKRERHDDFIAPAPKVYAAGPKARAKGFSGVGGFAKRATRSHVEALMAGEPLELWGMLKLRGRIKKGGDSLPLIGRMHKRLRLGDVRAKRAENRPWTVDEINS